MFFKNKDKNEFNYYDEFAKNASYSLECAKIIKEILEIYNQEQLLNNLTKIHELEHKADNGKHKMVNYLAKDFLPPIEREDIISLSQQIDDVTDLIEEILINIDMFNIKTIRKETNKFVELLLICCENECSLLNNFKNFKKIENIKSIVIEINRLEEEGDKLYTETMRNLYRDGTSTIEIIKWTTIFNCFENCFDICESLANNVESIVLKNL